MMMKATFSLQGTFLERYNCGQMSTFKNKWKVGNRSTQKHVASEAANTPIISLRLEE